MTVIALTTAKIGRAYPHDDEVFPVKLAEAVTAGEVGYMLAAGTYGVADANAAGKQQARVLFLEAGAAGEWVTAIKRGYVEGFTVSSVDCDSVLYVSDTAGDLDDTTGTLEVHVGRVAMVPGTTTKAVYVDFDWTTVWA